MSECGTRSLMIVLIVLIVIVDLFDIAGASARA
jgi:hypothetical protein